MKTDALPIIDCHQHLWDLTKFKLPWLTPGGPLGRSFVMKDYLAAIEGTGIKHAVYMEVDVDPSQQQAEIDHLTEICKSGKAPTIAAVVSGRPAADNFRDYIAQFKTNTYLKGIRQVLHGGGTPAGYCLSDEFVRGIRLLGEAGPELRPVHASRRNCPTGRSWPRNAPTRASSSITAATATPRRFSKRAIRGWRIPSPSTTPTPGGATSTLLAAQKNVICKISGIVARVPKEWSADGSRAGRQSLPGCVRPRARRSSAATGPSA